MITRLKQQALPLFIMASVALGVVRPHGLSFLIKRALPPVFVNKFQESRKLPASNVLESYFFPFISQFLNNWLPLNTLDLFWKSGILLAVPKKRVSHSRKRIRNFPKFPKNRTDIEICVVCRNEKLHGHLCGYCLENTRKKTEEVHATWPSYDLPHSMSR